MLYIQSAMNYKTLQVIVFMIGVGICFTELPSCKESNDCGWNSYCQNGQCWCQSGYSYDENRQDCTDTNCRVRNCIECIGETSCRRCSNYLDKATGECLDSCNGDYALVVDGVFAGKVCRENRGGLSMLYVAVIIAVCSGLLLTILLSLAVYWKHRTDRERELRLKIMGQMLTQEKEQRIATECRKTSGHINNSYEPSAEERRLRKLYYVQQLAVVKPHTPTLLAMLKEVKAKCRQVDNDEKRLLVYRNLIHELCRVITLLNDADAAMPSDGNLLLDWAQRILKDYMVTHAAADGRGEVAEAWTSTSIQDEQVVASGSADSMAAGSPVNSYSYQRLNSQKTERLPEQAEISGSQLLGGFTEPIEV